MAKVSFELGTSLPPERVMALLTDFSPRRPELWPTLAPGLYEVFQLEPRSADVKEGSISPARIWERVHYEWSANQVRWSVQESNYCAPGSYVEVTVRPNPDGGSRLQVDWSRRGVGCTGKLLTSLVVLTRGANLRRKVFQRALDQAERTPTA